MSCGPCFQRVFELDALATVTPSLVTVGEPNFLIKNERNGLGAERPLSRVANFSTPLWKPAASSPY